jgi:hypothetical protein
MTSVWILVFYMAGYQAGGPAVIDNISTQQECERVAALLSDLRRWSSDSRCIEVRKIK